MKTLAKDLLQPYREFLRGHEGTVAAAMLQAEASHAAEVRNAQPTPMGGWKNEYPLEHATTEGAFFKACRNGDKTHLAAEAKNNPRIEHRMRCAVLLNAENVLVTPSEYHQTVEELIQYAADCLDMPLDDELTVAGNYVPVVFVE